MVCALVWCALPQAEASGRGYHGRPVHGYHGRPYPADHYGRPYAGYHGGYRPHYRYRDGYRGWGGGPWIGISMPLYPRRYYERGSVAPDQPFPHAPPDSGAHRPPLPHTYQERGLGLDSLPALSGQKPPGPNPAGARSALPHADSTQPVMYPVMTRESREAWERHQRWVRGGVPVPFIGN